jgi:hypothetical protein
MTTNRINQIKRKITGQTKTIEIIWMMNQTLTSKWTGINKDCSRNDRQITTKAAIKDFMMKIKNKNQVKSQKKRKSSRKEKTKPKILQVHF